MSGKKPKADPYGRHPKLQKDFRAFLWGVWKHLNLPPPTPVQLDIASFLHHGPRRSVIQAFRGLGKSWITSAYCLWRLYCDPEMKILVVSANKSRADDFSIFCQNLIAGWEPLAFLRHKEGQRFSKVAFDVGPATPAHAPSVKSVGVFGQLQGPRANLIVPDDIESLDNAATVAKREKLGQVIKEFDSIIVPGGEVKYLGTPQSESSIYNVLPDRGYEGFRIWPARYPASEQRDGYGDRLAPMVREAVDQDPSLEGRPVDPDRFDEKDLAERELSYGRSGFQLQFMLDTRLSDMDRYPLRLSDLIVMPLGPDDGPEKTIWGSSTETEWQDLPNYGKDTDRFYGPITTTGMGWQPYESKILVLDPAGRGKDETAWAVLGQLHGQLFLLEIGADQRGYEDAVIRQVAHCAKKYGVHKVVYEANFGDGMAGQIMRPVFNEIYPVSIEEVKHSQQKERRIIDTLEPVMNRHKLIVSKQAVEQDHQLLQQYPPEQAKHYSLFFQMSRLTPERHSLNHDDRLDAVAMGVAWFQRVMSQDTKRQAQVKRDELLEEEIRRHEEKMGLRRADEPEGFATEGDTMFSEVI